MVLKGAATVEACVTRSQMNQYLRALAIVEIAKEALVACL